MHNNNLSAIQGLKPSGRNKDTVEEFWDQEVLETCIEQSARGNTSDFLTALKKFLDAKGKMWTTSSARMALKYFLLSSVSRKRHFVLLCSFNCPVLIDSVINAGFRIETFDFINRFGKIDWEQVADNLNEDHAALIIPHFFGVPYDFRPVMDVARKLGILVVEDCAHMLGGKIGSTMAGNIGDASIFSFNYDKPISLGGGGVLLVNNPDLITKINIPDPHVDFETERREMLRFMKFLKTRRVGINKQSVYLKLFIKLLRKLGLSLNYDSPLPKGIAELRSTLGLWQLKNYSKIIKTRNKNAGFFTGKSKCQSWNVDPDTKPAWVKQKIILGESVDLQKVAFDFQHLGLRIGPFNWPRTLDSFLGYPEKPNASYVAKHGFDVPIHQNMDQRGLNLILEKFCRLSVA